MTDGVELFTLRQRRTSNGDHYFTTQIGAAFVVMMRDPIERDIWHAIACDPARANTCDRPARAIAAAPVDGGDYDDGNHDEGDDDGFDDIPADVMAPSQ